MHSPDCRGPYTREDTSCYCGHAYELYCVRSVEDLQNTLGINYAYSQDREKAVEDLKRAAEQHVAWKKFAVSMLALATDTEEDLWVDEVLPPAEFLDHQYMFDLIVKLKIAKLKAGQT
jgi:hypothetical protein